MKLKNYKTGEYIREATEAEAEISRASGDTGAFDAEVDGKEVTCYVEE